MQDMHFALSGEYLPQHYHEALWTALCEALPWLADAPKAGMHFVQGSRNEDRLLLSRRAKLVLRLPAPLAEQAGQLVGQSLQVGETQVVVNKMQAVPLVEHPTLHAHMAVGATTDEAGFLAEMQGKLAGLGIPGKLICGRTQQIWLQGQPVQGYSLVVYGLKPAHSLQLQQYGLGKHRNYGCGLFIPYKVISGVE